MKNAFYWLMSRCAILEERISGHEDSQQKLPKLKYKRTKSLCRNPENRTKCAETISKGLIYYCTCNWNLRRKSQIMEQRKC
jgi:hypothetical protein